MTGLCCALTGHRDLGQKFDKNVLYDELEGLIKEGYTCFLDGMARGFDLIALECLVDLKQRYHVRIKACIPYEGQEDSMSPPEVNLYRSLLSWCDEKEVLAKGFRKGCLLRRDRYMVDYCDLLYAYLEREEGGTAYTVKYAKSRGVPIRYFGSL